MTAQQERKQQIRAFMHDHYTDERLAMLLAHARDGKLSYNSCCCFVGVPSANHRLHGCISDEYPEARMMKASYPPDVKEHSEIRQGICRAGTGADLAYRYLGIDLDFIENADVVRRRILIPMIRAEMRRREKLRVQTEFKQELATEFAMAAR